MYKLKNNQVLEVETKTISGMAGEPMQIAKLTIAGKPTTYKQVYPLMDTNDAYDLAEFLDDLSESNHDSAVNWVK